MKTKSIKQWAILPCSPDAAYDAWLDSKKHGDMVKGNASIERKVGGSFSVWDGEITGKTLEFHPDTHRIVQLWRFEYDDWPKDYFSKVTVQFVPYKAGQTKLRFWQSGIPEKYADEISEGWKDYYWIPMKEYFLKNK